MGVVDDRWKVGSMELTDALLLTDVLLLFYYLRDSLVRLLGSRFRIVRGDVAKGDCLGDLPVGLPGIRFQIARGGVAKGGCAEHGQTRGSLRNQVSGCVAKGGYAERR